MEGLGHYLKQGRSEAGLSLDDLAQRTRIRVENLASLEKEDLEALPTDPYVRGFVRQVCRELGLPTADGIVRYESLREQRVPVEEIIWEEVRTRTKPTALALPRVEPRRWIRAVVPWLGAAGIVLGLVALSIVGVRALRDRAPASDPVAVAPEGVAPPVEVAVEPTTVVVDDTPAPIVSPSPLLLGELLPEPVPASIPLEVVIDDTPSVIAGPVPLSLEDLWPQPVAPLRVVIDDRPGPVGSPDPLRLEDVWPAPAPREEVPERQVPEKPIEVAAAAPSEPVPSSEPIVEDPPREDSTPIPQTQPEEEVVSPPFETAPVSPAPLVASSGAAAGERLVLRVEALRDVEVSVLLDGIGHRRSKTLTAGATKIWKAGKRFVLSASDGGAVRLVLAGQDLGLAGPDGVAVAEREIRPLAGN